MMTPMMTMMTPPPMTPPPTVSAPAVPGAELRRAWQSAAAYLEFYRDAANALNVFPVPDGDTGTNMLLTLRAGIAGMDKHAAGANDGNSDADSAGAVAEALAAGAFWGARGNSGVILSQMLRGFANGAAGANALDAGALVNAFHSAAAAAYQAVGQPQEGTMLSVIRAAAEAAAAAYDDAVHSNAGPPDAPTLWQAAYAASIDALARTPEQLPVLKAAGVVDSGGLGIVAVLGGALQALQGRTGPPVDLGLHSVGGAIDPNQTDSVSIDADFLETHEGGEFGYCTQFVIHGAALNPDTLRAGFGNIADSTVVIGGGAAVRVHIHTATPGPALTYAADFGELDEIKIDNMSRQNLDWTAGHRERTAAPPPEIRPGVAVIAVAAGPGLAALFQDAGCAAIVPGGQTLNPSARELINAARAAGTDNVIILPNNGNIILTANQAAAGNGNGNDDGNDNDNDDGNADAAAIALHIVPTRSMPQGTAAMLGFNPELSVAQNLAQMTAASAAITSLEVTQAVRDSVVDGQPVRQGQYMALRNGKLAALSDAAAETALLDGLLQPGANAAGTGGDDAGIDADSIITIYWGEGGSAAKASGMQDALETAHPGIQVDIFAGGQPHYPYLASVE